MSLTDWQRQRLYDSEWAHQRRHPAETLPTTGESATKVLRLALEGLDGSPHVTPRAGHPILEVSARFVPGRGEAFRGLNMIKLGRITNSYVLVHEVAHLGSPTHFPGHGIEFAEDLLRVARHVFSNAFAADLEREFEKRGVQWDHAQRADYTRKRARWVFRPDNVDPWDQGQPNVSTIITRREVGGRRHYLRGRRVPDGIEVTDLAQSSTGLVVGEVISYESIAYCAEGYAA